MTKKILLGITGGIAAYKSAFLARSLVKSGMDVRVVMTNAAKEFISPITLQALTGNIVRDSLFDAQAERSMGHIELARWADLLVIAPTTANFMAKMAHGIADDLLSTLYLATNAPVIVCPAMNKNMWAQKIVQKNYQELINCGVIMCAPTSGEQACLDNGYGRMQEVDEIINAIKLHKIHNILLNKKILITAGPTEEAIDPVRYLTNESSGKMGYALARAASMAGANVTLVSGPTNLSILENVNCINVKSGREMHATVMQHMENCDVFIGASAVADYYIDKVSDTKLQKQTKLNLEFTLNPDILADVVKLKSKAFIVGFAAQTHDVIKNARQKLIKKNIDMIFANKVGENLGFNVDNNQVTMMTHNEMLELPLMHKLDLSCEIMKILAKKTNNIS